jgi:hypothetical protein
MLAVRGFIGVQDRSPRLAAAFSTRNEMFSDVLRSVRNVCHRSTTSSPAWLDILVIQGRIKEVIGD